MELEQSDLDSRFFMNANGNENMMINDLQSDKYGVQGYDDNNKSDLNENEKDFIINEAEIKNLNVMNEKKIKTMDKDVNEMKGLGKYDGYSHIDTTISHAASASENSQMNDDNEMKMEIVEDDDILVVLLLIFNQMRSFSSINQGDLQQLFHVIYQSLVSTSSISLPQTSIQHVNAYRSASKMHINDLLSRFASMPSNQLTKMVNLRHFFDKIVQKNNNDELEHDDNDDVESVKRTLMKLWDNERSMRRDIINLKKQIISYGKKEWTATSKDLDGDDQEVQLNSNPLIKKLQTLRNDIQSIHKQIKQQKKHRHQHLMCSQRSHHYDNNFMNTQGYFSHFLDDRGVSYKLQVHTAIQSTAMSKKIVGHHDCSFCIASDSIGKWVVTGADDKKLKLWNAHTGHLHATLRGHRNVICDVAIDPTDKIIASSDEKTIRLWDVETSIPLRMFQGHLKPITNICFASAGSVDKSIISGSEDGACCVWDYSETKLLPIVLPHYSIPTMALQGGAKPPLTAVSWIALHPKDPYLATVSDDGIGRLWVVSRSFERNITSSSSSQGYPSRSNILSINNINGEDRLVGYLKGHIEQLSSVVWSNVGDRIMTVSEKEGVARTWLFDSDIKSKIEEGLPIGKVLDLKLQHVLFTSVSKARYLEQSPELLDPNAKEKLKIPALDVAT